MNSCLDDDILMMENLDVSIIGNGLIALNTLEKLGM